MTKSLEKKGLFTGLIEQDENGNFFCGEYLLDYKMVVSNFKLGDKITLKTAITNPSDISFKAYEKKSKNFALFNLKPDHEK
ncbi:TPA: hypothetical protein ACGFUB_000706 [Flavobacterium psychrophilum]